MNNQKEYKKRFDFGKVAAGRDDRKRNAVDVSVELRIKLDSKQATFTASANVWNASHTDCIMGGQCLDDIWQDYRDQLSDRATYLVIMKLWRKWHLNDMHAGCKHQRELGWDKILLDDSKPRTQDNMAAWTHPKRTGFELIAYRLYNAIPYEFIIGGQYSNHIKFELKWLKRWIKNTLHVDVWQDEDKAHAKGVLGKPCPVCGYKYGTAWKHEAIDKKDLATICQLLEIPEAEAQEIIKNQPAGE